MRAFQELQSSYVKEPGVADSVLVIAGGYDKRLAENRECYAEMQDLVAECGLEQKVSRCCIVPSTTSTEMIHRQTSGVRPAVWANVPQCSSAATWTEVDNELQMYPMQAMLIRSFTDAERGTLLAASFAVQRSCSSAVRCS